MTYYDTFLDYVKNAVNYKMSILDPNLIKRFLYAINNAQQNSGVTVNAREVDD